MSENKGDTSTKSLVILWFYGAASMAFAISFGFAIERRQWDAVAATFIGFASIVVSSIVRGSKIAGKWE